MSSSVVKCPNCGKREAKTYKFCLACGTPLFIPSQLHSAPQRIEPPKEALEIYEHAMEMWRNAQKKGATNEQVWTDEKIWTDIAAQLSLAIEKAGKSPFPRAHAQLARILDGLHRNAEAERHAKIALEQNPNEFRAQGVLVTHAADKVKKTNIQLGLGDFIHIEQTRGRDIYASIIFFVLGTVVGTISKIIGTLIGILIHSGSAALTQNNFNHEIEKLVHIFTNVCIISTDVDEYLHMAEFLIGLGDVINEVSLSDSCPNLYAVVVSTSVDALNQSGREKEIIDARHIAEGKMALYKK